MVQLAKSWSVLTTNQKHAQGLATKLLYLIFESKFIYTTFHVTSWQRVTNLQVTFFHELSFYLKIPMADSQRSNINRILEHFILSHKYNIFLI